MWEEAEKFLSEDKYIAPLINKYGHCMIKPRKRKYYFEDLVDAIVQQQLSIKAASSIFNRIKERINNKSFPIAEAKNKGRNSMRKNVEITPLRIKELPDEELRECGLSRSKVVYIRDLTNRVLSNKLEISKLDKLPDGEVVKELVSVKGIGEWTAHMFLMFTLGRPDTFPVGDLGLRKSFERTVKKRLSMEKMEKFALRWKPYRTVASWYIWKSLEN